MTRDRTATGASEPGAEQSAAKAAREAAAAALLRASSTDLYRNRAWNVAPGKTKGYYREKADVAIAAYLDSLLGELPEEAIREAQKAAGLLMHEEITRTLRAFLRSLRGAGGEA